MQDICPKCGEKINLHPNNDYSKIDASVDSVLCNECGEIFSNEITSVNIEENKLILSNEMIKKRAEEYSDSFLNKGIAMSSFIQGCNWYREELKKIIYENKS